MNHVFLLFCISCNFSLETGHFRLYIAETRCSSTTTTSCPGPFYCYFHVCLVIGWILLVKSISPLQQNWGAALHMYAHSLSGLTLVLAGLWLSFLWKHPAVFNNALMPKLLYRPLHLWISLKAPIRFRLLWRSNSQSQCLRFVLTPAGSYKLSLSQVLCFFSQAKLSVSSGCRDRDNGTLLSGTSMLRAKYSLGDRERRGERGQLPPIFLSYHTQNKAIHLTGQSKSDQDPSILSSATLKTETLSHEWAEEGGLISWPHSLRI